MREHECSKQPGAAGQHVSPYVFIIILIIATPTFSCLLVDRLFCFPLAHYGVKDGLIQHLVQVVNFLCAKHSQLSVKVML